MSDTCAFHVRFQILESIRLKYNKARKKQKNQNLEVADMRIH
jgi:hypothetical protein